MVASAVVEAAIASRARAVGRVGDDQRPVRPRGGQRRAHPLELVPGAPGERHAGAGRGVAGEVVGGQGSRRSWWRRRGRRRARARSWTRTVAAGPAARRPRHPVITKTGCSRRRSRPAPRRRSRRPRPGRTRRPPRPRPQVGAQDRHDLGRVGDLAGGDALGAPPDGELGPARDAQVAHPLGVAAGGEQVAGAVEGERVDRGRAHLAARCGRGRRAPRSRRATCRGGSGTATSRVHDAAGDEAGLLVVGGHRDRSSGLSRAVLSDESNALCFHRHVVKSSALVYVRSDSVA